ncbi:hypothetical protein GCM10022296_06130 [Secundilactobacillus similis DSM 23365 = JCM 2765]
MFKNEKTDVDLGLSTKLVGDVIQVINDHLITKAENRSRIDYGSKSHAYG